MLKKTTLLTLLTTLLFVNGRSECVLIPLPLAERVAASNLIVEAKVTQIRSYWNSERTMIYTASTLSVSRVYKGIRLLPSNSLEIITLGGNVDDKTIKVEPELEMATGEIGIFLLVEKNGVWVAESGPQGFIKVDKVDGSASDVFNLYPPFSIYAVIENLTNIKATDINTGLTKILISTKRAAATITSISPKTISSGTTSTLTIKGTNFKSVIDTSSVMFKNADDGGISYLKALKKDYISWSDTMIRLIVRSKAGTGKIRVLIGGNGLATSADTLHVSYAHSNVVQGLKSDSIGFETQEIGMNVTNGITWKISKRFYDSIAAKGAFIRSLERWRCGTFINWDTLGKVNYSAIKFDGVNMCAWDTNSIMPSGVLAQCFSYYSGCFVGPNLKYFVSEMDIRFRIKPTSGTNWNYSIGSATGTQYHFETVATHELGHGHQLGHVIAPATVMHYSIANGQVKPGLTASDLSAGNFVIAKSASSVCGKSVHAKLNSGNCAIVPPSANFSISKSTICKNESLKFTDSSKGNITAYSWNFGVDASPATANTVGPHTVTYSSGGSKNITLTITTSTSSTLFKTKTITVKADSKMKPDFIYAVGEKGKITFTNTSNNSTADKWYFGDMDSSVSANPVHTYAAGGTYNVRLISVNTCNTEDTVKSITFAFCDTLVKANFTFGNYGNQIVGFTNNSTGSKMTSKWYFGDGDSSTQKNPVHSYTNSNNKVVRLVVSGPCNTDDTIITLKDFTAINHIKSEALFSIYPNPVNQYFNIVSSVMSDLKLEITDMSGKVVLFLTAQNNSTIVSGDLANGIYMANISANGFRQTVKFVVQH